MDKNKLFDWQEIIKITGSEAAAKDIVAQCMAGLPEIKQKALDSFNAKDYMQLREEIHKLTGIAAFFSSPLRQVSHDLETAIVKADQKSIEFLIEKVGNMISELLLDYEQHIGV